MNKILLIGKRHKRGREDLSGGVIVLFESLIKDFENRGINFEVVDLNYRNYASTHFVSFFLIYLRIFQKIFRSRQVMLNGSNNCLVIYAPILRLTTWILGKPFYIRLFGGKLDKYIDSINVAFKLLAKFSIRTATKIFYEPKHILNKFKKYNKNSVWFPNVRFKNPLKTDSIYSKKLVFLGHVKEDKGINYLLDAYVKLIDDGYTLEIYGPEVNYTCPEQYFDVYNKVYKGAVISSDVNKVLSLNDVLVLPTFYKGEGYPGAIIEALNAGLPIVATKLDGIKEMIDNSCGVLIKQQSSSAIIEGVKKIDNYNYSNLSINALKRFEWFDSDKVMDRIIKELGFNNEKD